MDTTTTNPHKLLTLMEVANMLGIPKATMYTWRSRNYGPAAVKVGGHLRYRESDIEAWIDEMAAADKERFTR